MVTVCDVRQSCAIGCLNLAAGKAFACDVSLQRGDERALLFGILSGCILASLGLVQLGDGLTQDVVVALKCFGDWTRCRFLM